LGVTSGQHLPSNFVEQAATIACNEFSSPQVASITLSDGKLTVAGTCIDHMRLFTKGPGLGKQCTTVSTTKEKSVYKNDCGAKNGDQMDLVSDRHDVTTPPVKAGSGDTGSSSVTCDENSIPKVTKATLDGDKIIIEGTCIYGFRVFNTRSYGAPIGLQCETISDSSQTKNTYKNSCGAKEGKELDVVNDRHDLTSPPLVLASSGGSTTDETPAHPEFFEAMYSNRKVFVYGKNFPTSQEARGIHWKGGKETVCKNIKQTAREITFSCPTRVSANRGEKIEVHSLAHFEAKLDIKDAVGF